MTTTTRRQDLTGRSFGRLTVIEFAFNRKKKVYWYASCNCGSRKVIIVAANNFRNGHITSCGCYRRERMIERRRSPLIANHRKEYKTWRMMKARCYDPNHHSFHRYGGRGISVCQRWLNSFEYFIGDMGKAPSSSHSIDRTDNDGNYSPENCRWATKKEQSRNRGNNRVISYKGESLPLIVWAERFSLPGYIISSRLKKGWDVERAFCTPIQELYSKKRKPISNKPIEHNTL